MKRPLGKLRIHVRMDLTEVGWRKGEGWNWLSIMPRGELWYQQRITFRLSYQY